MMFNCKNLFCSALTLMGLAFAYIPGESGFISTDYEHGIWGNPAGLTALGSRGALVSYDYDKETTNFRMGGNLDHWAAGYQYTFDRDHHNEARWSVGHGSAFLSNTMFWGTRITALRSSEFDGTEWSLSQGFIYRPFNFLSLGYSTENLLYVGPKSPDRILNLGATLRVNNAFNVSYDVENLENHRLLLEMGAYGFRFGFMFPLYGNEKEWRLSVSTSLGGYSDVALHVYDDLLPKGGVFSYHSSRSPKTSMRGKIVRIPLDMDVTETSESMPFLGERSINIWKVRNLFEHIYQDPSCGLVILDFSGYRGNLGISSEIDAAVQKLKAKGGFVISYVDDIRPAVLMASAHVDRIVAEPSAHLTWRGLGGDILYYKGLFDKLGVKVEFLRHGKFKSAVEPYIADSMSVEARSNMDSLYKNLWWMIEKSIARRLPSGIQNKDAFLDSLASNPVITAKAAQKAHLIDTTLYIDQVPAYTLKTLFDLDAPNAYATTWRPMDTKIFDEHWGPRKEIAVLNINGTIDNRMEKKVMEQLRELPGSSAKALIVRISSPGGSAIASDKIWGALRHVSELGIPVVASIGNIGASGGYFIACGADMIVSEPFAIVGSIGIYGGKVDASGLLEKLGLRSEAVKTHPYADAQTFNRPWTDVEKAALQEYMDDFYERFTGVVSKATKIPQSVVDSLYGGGRVMSGLKARDAGLVHRLGGIDEAILAAKELAGMSASTEVKIHLLNSDDEFAVPSLKANAAALNYAVDFLMDLEQVKFWAIEPMFWGIE
ncbi:signal peptide peptidase SppA [Fibrobacter sp. UWEL]|uniref:signal peptide peptidase SppA n=1 Tax=Fibrobacter sp. UWEL TaxID=1896209 RepID=UPI00091EB570|nr:signal peptide peptidase SppA [Fibrobacter sp. UWEL]SHK91627.1 protease-4 [Fibrobacter sp. UWEL]